MEAVREWRHDKSFPLLELSLKFLLRSSIENRSTFLLPGFYFSSRFKVLLMHDVIHEQPPRV